MKISTGAFFFICIPAGRVVPFIGLQVFALGTPGTRTGEARSLPFGGEEKVEEVASFFGKGGVASLTAGGGGTVALQGDDVAGFDSGEIEVGVAWVGIEFLALEGFVKALSLFSLSSLVMTFGRGSSRSSLFLLGAKTSAGLMEGSKAVGIAAFRWSSMSVRGAVRTIARVVVGFERLSIGAKIPGRVDFWKWLMALASFRNLSNLLLLLTNALASPSLSKLSSSSRNLSFFTNLSSLL